MRWIHRLLSQSISLCILLAFQHPYAIIPYDVCFAFSYAYLFSLCLHLVVDVVCVLCEPSTILVHWF
jgi:hypothetical protein